jgi:hypothetical protein
MGRKHRKARKNSGARACAHKKPLKAQPPTPPPETVGWPELPFDVIPLVLHALLVGCNDRDPEATVRAAECWSTLNKTHREACAADPDQVWEGLIARDFPRHTPAVIAERGLLSFDCDFDVCGNSIEDWLTEPDPKTFDTVQDYYFALYDMCIVLVRARSQLKEVCDKAEDWQDWWDDPYDLRPNYGSTSLEVFWEQCEPIYRDLVETQHEVYMCMAIVRGLDFHHQFLHVDHSNLGVVAEKMLNRIRKNYHTMGEDWDLDFPDLKELRARESEI